MESYKILRFGTVMDNPESQFNYFGWPSVARLSDGRLCAAASGFRRYHVCPFGKAVIAFSSDEGKTWTRPTPVIDTVLDDRDAGVVPLGGSRVMVTSFNNSISCQQYWNDIRRAERGVEGKDQYSMGYLNLVDAYLQEAASTGMEAHQYGSTYRISDDNGVTFGPLYISPVTCPHGPCVTKDGRIIYVGHPFSDEIHPAENPDLQCWELDGKGGAAYLSTIERFEDADGPFGEICEPHTICLDDGRLLCHIRVQRGGMRYFSTWQTESADGGRTWSPARSITGPFGGAPAHRLQLRNGDLISVVGDRQPPYGIRVLRSRDGGETWTDRPLKMGMPNLDLGYPASVELNDGTVYTLWYQNMGDGKPAVIVGAQWDPES